MAVNDMLFFSFCSLGCQQEPGVKIIPLKEISSNHVSTLRFLFALEILKLSHLNLCGVSAINEGSMSHRFLREPEMCCLWFFRKYLCVF